MLSGRSIVKSKKSPAICERCFGEIKRQNILGMFGILFVYDVSICLTNIGLLCKVSEIERQLRT